MISFSLRESFQVLFLPSPGWVFSPKLLGIGCPCKINQWVMYVRWKFLFIHHSFIIILKIDFLIWVCSFITGTYQGKLHGNVFFLNTRHYLQWISTWKLLFSTWVEKMEALRLRVIQSFSIGSMIIKKLFEGKLFFSKNFV